MGMRTIFAALVFAGLAAAQQTVDWPNQIKRKPALDIRTYGAKCDGTTDDSAAINACLAALPIGGGSCTVPAGTCIAQSIELNSLGQFLTGQPAAHSVGGTGDGASRIRQKAGKNKDYVVRLSSALTGLRDLIIDGNKSQNPTAKDVLLVDDTSRVDIQNVTFQNGKRNGIRISSSVPEYSCCGKYFNVMVFDNDASGLYCSSASDTFVTQSEFLENGRDGMELVSCHTWRIVNSDISANARYGFNWTGVAAHGNGNVMLVNNAIAGNLQEELIINGYDGAAQVGIGFSIVGNHFQPGAGRTANTYSAIKIIDSPGNTITGNVIYGDAGYKYGIQIVDTGSGRSNYNSVIGNSYNGSFGTFPIVMPSALNHQIGNGALASGFGSPLGPLPLAFANLTDYPAASFPGTIVYCADCAAAAPCTGSGTGRLAVSDGTNWNCQ